MSEMCRKTNKTVRTEGSDFETFSKLIAILKAIDWKQVVAGIIVAAGGAAIGYFFNKRQDRRELRVKIYNGLPLYDSGPGDACLFIEVSNPRAKAVVVNTPSLILPRKKQRLVFPYPQASVRFPHNLQEGHNCELWIGLRDLADRLYEQGYKGVVNLRAEVTSHAGDSYTSKVWSFHLDGWPRHT